MCRLVLEPSHVEQRILKPLMLQRFEELSVPLLLGSCASIGLLGSMRHECLWLDIPSAAVQFATEAAITVLRIDDMIKLEKGEDEME